MGGSRDLRAPFLVRRDDAWGFCSAEFLRVGDWLITAANGELDEEERIETLERNAGPVRTVAIRVCGTNTYLADVVWTHNDAPSSPRSGPGISDSAGDGGPTNSARSSPSSSSSSGSRSSGSSFSV